MTSYDELISTVNIKEVEDVYYGNEHRLDLEKTLELMKETLIEDFDSNIEFYGKDFKVSMFQLDEGPEFVRISLVRPNSKETHKPFTVDVSEKKYSSEHQKQIPFMTEQMIEDERESVKRQQESIRRRKEEQNQKEIDYINEKEEYADASEKITDEDLFTIFEGGRSGHNAYITIPYYPDNSTTYRVTDDDFLTPDVRKVIDYVGYAVKVDGEFRVFAKKSLYTFTTTDETENERQYREVMSKLEHDGKIVPILGIATETVSGYPKEIFEDNLESIKNYFGHQLCSSDVFEDDEQLNI